MEHRSLSPDFIFSDDDHVGGNKCTRESTSDVAPQELRKEEQMGGPVNCSDSELSIYLQALAEGFLPTFYSDTSQCAQSRLMSIASKSYRRGKQTVLFHGFPSLQMSQNLTEDRGAVLLMSWLAASRVRTSAPQEMATELTASAPASGAKWPALSVKYDPVTSSWKTAHCLWEEDLPWSSVTLPTWGMTRSGSVYRHLTAERPIRGTGHGLWPTPLASDGAKGGPNQRGGKGDLRLPSAVHQWPTPTVCGNHNRKGASATSGDGLATAVTQRTWPTPTASDSEQAGGRGCISSGKRGATLHYSVSEHCQPGQQTPPMRLNPEWVEWLMGWPIGHTGLKPLATGRYQEWLQQHSPRYLERKEAA